jgi:peroxiredoxin
VGLSTQGTSDQREAVERLHLPFVLVSGDARLRLMRAMRLPTFEVAGHVLLKRFTLMIRGGHVEHVFFPVFPPDRHAEEVLRWLDAHPFDDRLP